jgi:hypothetical protein
MSRPTSALLDEQDADDRQWARDHSRRVYRIRRARSTDARGPWLRRLPPDRCFAIVRLPEMQVELICEDPRYVRPPLRPWRMPDSDLAAYILLQAINASRRGEPDFHPAIKLLDLLMRENAEHAG